MFASDSAPLTNPTNAFALPVIRLKLSSMLIEGKTVQGIFCLFHQNVDCSCINPAMNREELIFRLNQEIKVKEILNRNYFDREQKERRSREIAAHKLRLLNLVR